MKDKYIADGMRCINCYQPARKGKIEHKPGCPDYVKK